MPVKRNRSNPDSLVDDDDSNIYIYNLLCVRCSAESSQSRGTTASSDASNTRETSMIADAKHGASIYGSIFDPHTLYEYIYASSSLFNAHFLSAENCNT